MEDALANVRPACVSRREFLGHVAAGAGALAFGASCTGSLASPVDAALDARISARADTGAPPIDAAPTDAAPIDAARIDLDDANAVRDAPARLEDSATSNRGPVWAIVPTIIFREGVPSSISIAEYVTDADGDALVIELNAAPLPAGVTYDAVGQRFVYDGTGASAMTTGHVLTADDGRG